MTEVRIQDVAALAQVSVTTVSNALNHPELVSARAAEKVREAVAALGYVPNVAARQLRAGRSQVIGMAVFNITNPFFADVVLGAEEAASARGYNVVVGNSHGSPDKQARSLDLFERHRYDGVLVAPVGDDTTPLDRFAERGVPAVLLDRHDPRGRIPSVSVDDVLGGRIAVRHLARSGCRRIWFLRGSGTVTQIEERQRGAEQAAREAGVGLETVRLPTLNPTVGRELGERIAAMPRGERPDGLFAANDMLALGVLQALLHHGIAVPDEVSLVGYDDIEFASSSIVPLTSVRQPSYQLGATATRLLLEQLDDRPSDRPPRSERFEPELVIRATTRKDPA